MYYSNITDKNGRSPSSKKNGPASRAAGRSRNRRRRCPRPSRSMHGPSEVADPLTVLSEFQSLLPGTERLYFASLRFAPRRERSSHGWTATVSHARGAMSKLLPDVWPTPVTACFRSRSPAVHANPDFPVAFELNVSVCRNRIREQGIGNCLAGSRRRPRILSRRVSKPFRISTFGFRISPLDSRLQNPRSHDTARKTPGDARGRNVAAAIVYPVLLPTFVGRCATATRRSLRRKSLSAGLELKIGLMKAQSALNESRAASLPPNPVDAQREYQEWLNDLALLSNWRDPKITLGSRTPRGAMTAIPITSRPTPRWRTSTGSWSGWKRRRLCSAWCTCNSTARVFEGNPQLAVDLTVEGLAVSMPRRARDCSRLPSWRWRSTRTTRPSRPQCGGLPQASAVPRAAGTTNLSKFNPSPTTRGPSFAAPTVRPPPNMANRTRSNSLRYGLRRWPTGRIRCRSCTACSSGAAEGPLQLAAELQPAIRGTEWTAELQVQNWDPEFGTPEYRLDAGAPAGMTLDPRDGTLTWTPPEDTPSANCDCPRGGARYGVRGAGDRSRTCRSTCDDRTTRRSSKRRKPLMSGSAVHGSTRSRQLIPISRTTS